MMFEYGGKPGRARTTELGSEGRTGGRGRARCRELILIDRALYSFVGEVGCSIMLRYRRNE